MLTHDSRKSSGEFLTSNSTNRLLSTPFPGHRIESASGKNRRYDEHDVRIVCKRVIGGKSPRQFNSLPQKTPHAALRDKGGTVRGGNQSTPN